MCPALEDLKTITDASPLKYVQSTEKVCKLNYVGQSAESIFNIVNNGGYLFLPSDSNHFNFDQFKTTF